MKLSELSLRKLEGVHDDLVRVVKLAAEISTVEFVVTEGLRTLDRQKQLVASGASQTMKSRHLTGHAVDLAAKINGEVRWDFPLYDKLAEVMKKAALSLNISITWGGDWVQFRDGPHYQLSWDKYPL